MNDPSNRSRRGSESFEIPPGVECWQAPHLFLLHSVLTFLGSLRAIGVQPRVLVCDLRAVPVLDTRACHAISLLYWQCRRGHMALVLGGVSLEASRALGAKGILDEVGPSNVLPCLNSALSRARVLVDPN